MGSWTDVQSQNSWVFKILRWRQENQGMLTEWTTWASDTCLSHKSPNYLLNFRNSFECDFYSPGSSVEMVRWPAHQWCCKIKDSLVINVYYTKGFLWLNTVVSQNCVTPFYVWAWLLLEILDFNILHYH